MKRLLRTPRSERIAQLWIVLFVLDVLNRDRVMSAISAVGLAASVVVWLHERRSRRRIVTASPKGRPYHGAGVGVRYYR